MQYYLQVHSKIKRGFILVQKKQIIEDSQSMKYHEIFDFLLKHKDKIVARVHTGDPSIYSNYCKTNRVLKRAKY